jgi:thiol-disulfide isomerase/thioredoxin
MKIYNKYLCVFTLVLLVLHSNAQNTGRVIKGVVLDDESLSPLEGVEIIAKSSKINSGSQTDGIFSIPIKENDSALVFSFENYKTQIVSISKDNELNIRLKKSSSTSDEVNLAQLAGNWRGVFQLSNGIEVPFLFNIRQNGSEWTSDLINGEEHFPTGTIDARLDSFYIPLPLFENELVFSLKNNQLVGYFRKVDLKGPSISVQAEKASNFRFAENGSSPLKDISGRYKVIFKNAKSGQEETAVGIFQQKGSKVAATFLRVTGDARYLEGNVQDNIIQLSSFIGSTPSYYKATVSADGIINGEVIGIRGNNPFTATPDANAALPDAYKLTYLKGGKNKIEFSFPDGNNKIINSTDPNFVGKPLIITIGGTWCPNCMDEANFLGPWYQKNKSRGIEIVSLQYERQTDPAYVKKAFDRFKKQFNITYPLLIGGVADKQVVVNSLGVLENFISFPTTIFVGKDGNVKKIHTGFSGPATGKDYDDFIAEFNQEVDSLLK